MWFARFRRAVFPLLLSRLLGIGLPGCGERVLVVTQLLVVLCGLGFAFLIGE